MANKIGPAILLKRHSNTRVRYYCPKNLKILALKNCLLGVVNIVKNIDKSRYVCKGYGIAFNGLWSRLMEFL